MKKSLLEKSKANIPTAKRYFVMIAEVEYWVKISKQEVRELFKFLGDSGYLFSFRIKEEDCYISIKEE